MYQQRTLKRAAEFEGVGLHGGKPVKVRLNPSRVDEGIVFERADIAGRPRIKATPHNVIATDLASTIGTNGVRVGTVEHLMATLYAYGIDNALVQVAGDEIPIMDGSAAQFVSAIKNAGAKTLPGHRKFFIIRKKFAIREGDRYVSVEPAENFKISFTIDFDHPSIEEQTLCVDLSSQNFEREISSARTFGFLHEVQAMNARGLAKGGGLHNAVVVDKMRVLNREGLRFPDEFVRHKILDQIGDLALLGGPIIGHVKAYKSGHELNHKFVAALLEHPDVYQLKTFDDESDYSAAPLWRQASERGWAEA